MKNLVLKTIAAAFALGAVQTAEAQLAIQPAQPLEATFTRAKNGLPLDMKEDTALKICAMSVLRAFAPDGAEFSHFVQRNGDTNFYMTYVAGKELRSSAVTIDKGEGGPATVTTHAWFGLKKDWDKGSLDRGGVPAIGGNKENLAAPMYYTDDTMYEYNDETGAKIANSHLPAARAQIIRMAQRLRECATAQIS